MNHDADDARREKKREKFICVCVNMLVSIYQNEEEYQEQNIKEMKQKPTTAVE